MTRLRIHRRCAVHNGTAMMTAQSHNAHTHKHTSHTLPHKKPTHQLIPPRHGAPGRRLWCTECVAEWHKLYFMCGVFASRANSFCCGAVGRSTNLPAGGPVWCIDCRCRGDIFPRQRHSPCSAIAHSLCNSPQQSVTFFAHSHLKSTQLCVSLRVSLVSLRSVDIKNN